MVRSRKKYEEISTCQNNAFFVFFFFPEALSGPTFMHLSLAYSRLVLFQIFISEQ